MPRFPLLRVGPPGRISNRKGSPEMTCAKPNEDGVEIGTSWSPPPPRLH
jgi:hypothetical protein